MSQATRVGASAPLRLRVGDVVEVRSAEEIRATLDERGELENLPFMPEMLAFCGRRLTVHKVAHKLCDTISASGMRSMERAVHLAGARCDGSAHGGCQTACSLYWKEAWLRRVDDADASPDPVAVAPSTDPAEALRPDGRSLLPLLVENSRRSPGPDGEVRYSCQATELLRAAPRKLPLLDLRQYVDDVNTGNASVPFVARSFLVGLFNRWQRLSKERLPERLRFRQGLPWRFLRGSSPGRTPAVVLDLQPGDRVRVRTREQITATLDDRLLNRGMGFDAEMSRYCGTTGVVQSRIERCIDEESGRMLTMKTPCIVLENMVCAGAYNRVCPREFVPFWREIWLERVPEE